MDFYFLINKKRENIKIHLYIDYLKISKALII